MDITPDMLEKVTDAMIDNARAWARRGRMNADKRVLLEGLDAGGDTAKRTVISVARHHAREIFLSDSLVESIEKYLDWDDTKDPGKLGALNLVAVIGERVVAAYLARRSAITSPPTGDESP